MCFFVYRHEQHAELSAIPLDVSVNLPRIKTADMPLLRSVLRPVQFDRPSITGEEGSF